MSCPGEVSFPSSSSQGGVHSLQKCDRTICKMPQCIHGGVVDEKAVDTLGK